MHNSKLYKKLTKSVALRHGIWFQIIATTIMASFVIMLIDIGSAILSGQGAIGNLTDSLTIVIGGVIILWVTSIDRWITTNGENETIMDELLIALAIFAMLMIASALTDLIIG